MNHPARIVPATIACTILSGAALLATLCLGSGTSTAQTLRMGGAPPPSGGPRPSEPPRPLFRPAPPTVVSSAPSVVYQPRFFYSVPPSYYRAPHGHVPYYQQPVPYAYAPPYLPGPYIAPSYGHWAPGYWAYAWVPQSQASNAWVPGYYDKDGVWVAGYFATQATQSGYYQPYWVSGYWVP